MDIQTVFNSTPIILGDHDKAPARFLLLREGDIGWAGMRGYVLDAETAQRIIEAFEAHGSKIPIDYHHATEKIRPEIGGKAPAAGWIGKLEYVEGKGLYAADVEWTDEGRADVEQRRFLYTSPAILAKDKRIISVSSVALTNKPRTIDAEELLKAAEMVRNGDDDMKYENYRKRVGELMAALHVECAQDAIEEVPAVDASQKAIADLINVLQSKGVTIDEQAPLADVIRAAIEFIGAQEPTEETPPEETPPAEPEAEESKKAEREVKAAQYEKLAAEVKQLRTVLAERDAAEKAARIDALIAEQVESNRLNPNDADAMKAARALAEKDEDAFVKLFQSIEPYAPSAATEGPKHNQGGKRASRIHAARAEWSEHRLDRMVGLAEYVDQDLRDAGLPLLSEEERKALV